MNLTELNRPEQVDPVTRRVIGHARQLNWRNLEFANWSLVQFSSVQFICCEQRGLAELMHAYVTDDGYHFGSA